MAAEAEADRAASSTPDVGTDSSAPASASERCSPVMTVIAKRLRAAKKRLRGLEDIEAKKAAGKDINADQAEALKAKPGILAVIEELEKTVGLLRDALFEELASATEKAVAEALEAVRAEQENLPSPVNDAAPVTDFAEGNVGRFIELIYFSQAFSDASATSNERALCRALEFTREGGVPLLSEEDLDAIHFVGKLLTSRQANQLTASHKEVLTICKELATKLATGSQEAIVEANIRVEELWQKLAILCESPYALAPAAVSPTATVEQQVDETPEEPVALQAAVGDPVSVPVPKLLPEETYPAEPVLSVPPSEPDTTHPLPVLPVAPPSALAAPAPRSPVPEEPSLQPILAKSPEPEVARQAPASQSNLPSYYPAYPTQQVPAPYMMVMMQGSSLQPPLANGTAYNLPQDVQAYGFMAEPQAAIEPSADPAALQPPPTALPDVTVEALPQHSPPVHTTGRGMQYGYGGRSRGPPPGDRARGGRGGYGRRGGGRSGEGRGEGNYFKYPGQGGRGGRGGRGRSYQPVQPMHVA